MKLDSPFEQALERLPEAQLQQVMLWYVSGGQSVETRSEKLQQVLDDLESLDFMTCFELLRKLEPKDAVAITLMQEFGPAIAHKKLFAPLVKAVVTQLEHRQVQEALASV